MSNNMLSMQSVSGSIAFKQNSAVSVYIGIASLVLEGRQISTDEDDDSFSIKFDSAPNKTFSDESRAVDTVGSTGGSSTSRQGVIHRIGEKLMRLRQFPGSSKDVVEQIAIPIQSREDCEYERQPRLLHVASAREFHRSPRLAPTSTASSSTSATSVLHDIDVDWNDISILFNGLDSLMNLPGSPIKLSSSQTFRASLAGHHPMYSDTSASLFKNKEKPANKGTVKPKQGPHCEKFLKKIGILKTDPAETETVHMCNHVSDYCRRWQFHLKKMMQILTKGEDACIEVYLGPENNAILLEQWTFKLTNEPSPTTMTIQALCRAIRSQLYFSQVSSWVDLLKKTYVGEGSDVKEKSSKLFSPEIMQNPRLKKNLETMQADLDILFRIKSHDGASCFNDKPNVHNFPDTLVSDRMALRVCLKSLPRLDKIPTLNTEKANINGFSCDNRIKVSLGVSAPLGSPVAGSSFHLMNDRVSPAWCHEKGKHRCKHEDDEECDEENLENKKTQVAKKSFATPQQAASTSHTPKPTSPIPLSHRERQLLKYKKRLMKRDKQKKKIQDGDQTSVSSLNTSGSEEFEKFEETAINDTFAPLYSAKGGSIGSEKINITATATITNAASNKSIATQTEKTINDDDDDDSTSRCDSCGEDLQCRNCDKNQISLKSQTTTSLSVNIGSVVGTMIGNKADLLLQAIQRTADAHHGGSTGVAKRDSAKENIFVSPKSHRGVSSSPTQSFIVTDERSETCDTINDNNNYLINNNNIVGDDCRKVGVLQETDCRLCKRQKTKHNYSPSMSASTSTSISSYRRTMSECLVGISPDGDLDDTDGAMSCHSPLPVHNCDDAEFNYASSLSSVSVDDALSYGCLKAYRRAFSEDVINQLPAELCCFEQNDDDDCLTLKCNHFSSEKTNMESPASLKLTPVVSLQQGQYLNSTSPRKKVLNQKIPKINLSQLFDNIQSQNDSGIQDTVESPTSDNVFPFNSYPPTPNQLSPRTPSSGTNSLMKRRSRHISDRSSISEYSNISDEEDELSKATVGPQDVRRASTKISSIYKKFVIKTHAAFNKLPLLGTIEESLLRDRFQPKAIVNGFKLLLGASGSFCPTQLTIPAQTFCYEFQGIKHMSTPYVCEFRLARKGYSIPPTGTVQATLLNPQGTVVRMFFVPYDFRDMPAMSQTFIRQRVLAIDEHVSQKEAEQMSTVEQMKHLRYVIHLKFQTGRTGRLCLHTDLKLLISRRTEFDTAQAHAKNSLESPNDLKTISISPENPKFSSRIDKN